MPQKRTGFTTMVDLREFNETTWSFLTNITMKWQYDGMAYLFREEGIPLYGIDRGTLKMNHPIACMAVPQHKDKNYGVDIFVPVKCKKRALKIIADAERVKACAELEAEGGRAARQEFEQAAWAAKESNAAAMKEHRRARRASFISALTPRFLAKSN
jgi:hypothetical protein